MASTDKDLKQKESAIRFCLISNTLPFLEVEIENSRELSDTSTTITDIDVLGISTNASGEQKRTIFDCKTLAKTSPINRAFWASGLMQYTECHEAFVILRKRASEAHRLSAKNINVHLYNETQFTNFSESYSLEFKQDYSYSTDINNWLLLSDKYKGNKFLSSFQKFLNNDLPLETEGARGIKRLLSALLKGRGELDPEKPGHQAVFLNALLMFCFSMSQIIHDLKSIIDFDSDRENYEKILKYYIWGGRDSFLYKRKLSELLASSETKLPTIELELKEWDQFIELTRKLLNSPNSIMNCCFLLRELSLRSASTSDPIKDQFLQKLIVNNSRARQFITTQAKYLVRATQLPTEFESNLPKLFDSFLTS